MKRLKYMHDGKRCINGVNALPGKHMEQDLVKALRQTRSRSKRALLDQAADRIEALERSVSEANASLIAALVMLEKVGGKLEQIYNCLPGGIEGDGHRD